MPLIFEKKHFLDLGIKNPGNIMGQFKRRNIFPLFQKNNGFPPGTDKLGQLFLGHSGTAPVILYFSMKFLFWH